MADLNSQDTFTQGLGIGTNAINSFNPSAQAGNQLGTFNALTGSQNAQTQDFLNAYKNTISGQPNLANTYASLGAQYNIPQLQQQTTNLNNAVIQTPQRNLNLAKGFNYDVNQVGQQTAQDLARLQPLASAATTAFQNAQGLVNQGVGYQQTQNQYELQPIQAQQALMNDAFARQYSGYTQAMQDEFNGLLQKMQSGITLSAAEIGRANTLATAEKSYQATIDAAKISAQNQILPTGATYYNPATGTAYNPFAKPLGTQ
jgi:hypothetical protein